MVNQTKSRSALRVILNVVFGTTETNLIACKEIPAKDIVCRRLREGNLPKNDKVLHLPVMHHTDAQARLFNCAWLSFSMADLKANASINIVPDSYRVEDVPSEHSNKPIVGQFFHKNCLMLFHICKRFVYQRKSLNR